MKKLLAALVLLPALAFGATYSTEQLVLTTSTQISRPATSQGLELLNLGPNAIWCSVGVAPVSGKSRKVAPGASWSVGIGANVAIFCLADTANQVTGGATVVTEAPF